MQNATANPAEALARALLTLSETTGTTATIEQQLPGVASLCGEHAQLREFLSLSTVADKGKRRAIEDIFEGQIHPLLLQYLLLLQGEHQLRHIGDIAVAYANQLSGQRQQAAGELETVADIAPERLAEIEREVGRILDRVVTLRVRKNPSLLGGIRVRVGSFVIDGTLDTQLEKIREGMMGRQG